MKRLLCSLGIVSLLAGSVLAASNWYPIIAPPNRPEAGQRYLQAVAQFCDGFFNLLWENGQMIQAKDGTDYAPVARKYGFVDAATGQVIFDAATAQAAHAELEAMLAAGSQQAALRQYCERSAP